MRSDFSFLSMVLWLGFSATYITPAAGQKYTEFPTPSVSPIDITNGPDGALWFTARGASKIGRITTSGAVTLFPDTTLSGNPDFITTGPDGALWFTENSASKIGRIPTTATPTNPQFSEFKVSGYLQGLTTGPDGALWYSASLKIGRMLVDGTVTNEFPSPGNSAITIGPDHRLWGGAGASMYKMNIEGGAAGQFETFQIPGVPGGFGHMKITNGPDGAVWYTEQRANQAGKIGRITTDGKITDFSIPTNASPWGITSGPDGALWFTECCILHPGSGTTAGNKIGRITVDGKITEFTIPADSSPGGITTGPDGALWFALGAGKIGRFEP